MNTNPKTIKYLVIAAIILSLATMAYLVYATIYRSDKVKVDIFVVPGNAKITLNNTASGSGTVYIQPGSYEVLVEKDGFTTHKEVVNIAKPSGAINVALVPESAEAKEWAEKNNDKYVQFEGRVGKQANEEGKKVIETNPIVEMLPYKNLIIGIGYQNDPEDPSGKSIIITVHAPEGYRQSAINKIVSWGYDPAELKIVFKEYENPFTL